jgi:hypothetical protein
MNRDFEIKQLLRAYRSGMMSEGAFDEEMTRLEHEAAGADQNAGFEAFGQHYRSERDALLSFFGRAARDPDGCGGRVCEMAAVCRTPGLRTGLIMIAATSIRRSAWPVQSGPLLGIASAPLPPRQTDQPR